MLRFYFAEYHPRDEGEVVGGAITTREVAGNVFFYRIGFPSWTQATWKVWVKSEYPAPVQVDFYPYPPNLGTGVRGATLALTFHEFDVPNRIRLISPADVQEIEVLDTIVSVDIPTSRYVILQLERLNLYPVATDAGFEIESELGFFYEADTPLIDVQLCDEYNEPTISSFLDSPQYGMPPTSIILYPDDTVPLWLTRTYSIAEQSLYRPLPIGVRWEITWL